jgi:transcriptional regulator with XRE-family HTH domain
MFRTDWLRAKRKEKRLSREKLAQMIGVSFNSIRFYEEGIRKPSIHTLEKLAIALKIKMDDLFDGKPSNEKEETSHGKS